jgi:hypothetical protein
MHRQFQQPTPSNDHWFGIVVCDDRWLQASSSCRSSERIYTYACAFDSVSCFVVKSTKSDPSPVHCGCAPEVGFAIISPQDSRHCLISMIRACCRSYRFRTCWGLTVPHVAVCPVLEDFLGCCGCGCGCGCVSAHFRLNDKSGGALRRSHARCQLATLLVGHTCLSLHIATRIRGVVMVVIGELTIGVHRVRCTLLSVSVLLVMFR